MSWRINEPEGAVAEEVVGLLERAQSLVFLWRRGRRWEFANGQVGDLAVPDTAVEGAVGVFGPGRVGPIQGAGTADDARVGVEFGGWEDVVPMGMAR